MRRILLPFLMLLSAGAASPALSADTCVPVGRWVEPETGITLAHGDFIGHLSKRPVVLLGETHNNPEHHRWQLHTLAALHARNANMVIAFEAFPRSTQPSLDKWIRGDLDEKALLEEVNWNDIWRFDSDLYMGLFNFARMHRIPMIAMNIDRQLIKQVSRDGWKAVPEDERLGVGDPATASKEYLDFLTTVFGQHAGGGKDKEPGNDEEDDGKIKAQAKPEFLDNPMFMRFVESQLTWDRAMAEKIAEARTKGGEPLVVGIVGQGHIQYGFGIPYQLADLGIRDAAVLLPWNEGEDCSEMEPVNGQQVADGVFGVAHIEEAEQADKPKLGVYIEDGDGGVSIEQVVEKSVADVSGLLKGDLVVEAAGAPVSKTAQLIEIVVRQAPGTWLPLKVKRGGETMEVIAKFPTRR